MFTGFMAEDPACASGTAAVSALLADLRQVNEVSLRTRQGGNMGRPSLLLTQVARDADGRAIVWLARDCVAVMAGSLAADPVA